MLILFWSYKLAWTTIHKLLKQTKKTHCRGLICSKLFTRMDIKWVSAEAPVFIKMSDFSLRMRVRFSTNSGEFWRYSSLSSRKRIAYFTRENASSWKKHVQRPEAAVFVYFAHRYGHSELPGEDAPAQRNLQVHHGQVSFLSGKHTALAELSSPQPFIQRLLHQDPSETGPAGKRQLLGSPSQLRGDVWKRELLEAPQEIQSDDHLRAPAKTLRRGALPPATSETQNGRFRDTSTSDD